MTTFRQLEALVAVAEMGTFEKAASRLQTSQAAISRLVNGLEDHFRRDLFNRDHRTSQLTVDGQEVLQRARSILRQRLRLMESLSNRSIAVDNLRIGVTELVAMTWLPRFIAELEELDARTHIELVVGLSPALYGLLKSARLDMAIIGNVLAAPDMSRVPVGSAQFGWYCAPNHRIATEPMLSALEEETLLVLGASSGTGLRLTNWFLGHDLRPKHVIHSDSWVAIAGMAAAGIGIGCLPCAAALDPVSRGALRRVTPPVAPPVLDYVALLRHDTASNYHRCVLQLAQSLCDFETPFQAQPEAELQHSNGSK